MADHTIAAWGDTRLVNGPGEFRPAARSAASAGVRELSCDRRAHGYRRRYQAYAGLIGCRRFGHPFPSVLDSDRGCLPNRYRHYQTPQ